MQKQWNSMLGVAEASDEENDIVKVCTAHVIMLLLVAAPFS